ncbi:MAG: GntR family transcriptional regulator [Pseudomonadota bacterium]
MSRSDGKDAYGLLIEAIDQGIYQPGARLVEAELADRFGVSRTPIREALQKLETMQFLIRNGRSLIVSKLDHTEVRELFEVRTELEGLAASLAAQHAAVEEIKVLQKMVDEDRKISDHPNMLARTNRRFHHQLHLASHNGFLIEQLNAVHQRMALLVSSSLAVEGRANEALDEHQAIVDMLAARNSDGAREAIKTHLSRAFEMRLRLQAGEDR